MALSVEELVEHAMRLPIDSRARLAGLIFESLDDEHQPDVDAMWLAEANRRLDDYLAGRVVGIPGDEVLRRARELLST